MHLAAVLAATAVQHSLSIKGNSSAWVLLNYLQESSALSKLRTFFPDPGEFLSVGKSTVQFGQQWGLVYVSFSLRLQALSK